MTSAPTSETGGTPLSMAALLALPELRLLARSPVMVDWLGPLCLVPAVEADSAPAAYAGEHAVRITPEDLRMAVAQDCICRLVPPSDATAEAAPPPPPPPPPRTSTLPTTALPLPTRPPPPPSLGAGDTDAAGAIPTLGGTGSSTVDSAGRLDANAGWPTVGGRAMAVPPSRDDLDASSLLGVGWEAGALSGVGCDAGRSSIGSISGSDFLSGYSEPVLDAPDHALVGSSCERAVGATGVAGPLDIPATQSVASPPPRLDDDDGSGVGRVFSASSDLHVPIFAKDGVVCGLTFSDIVVNHVDELPGEFFHSPITRFALDLATGWLLSVITNGSRAIICNRRFDLRSIGGGNDRDAEAPCSDSYSLSWVRPRTPGGEVLVTARASLVMNALDNSDGVDVATLPPFSPRSASTPSADTDVDDLRRCFASILSSFVGTFGCGLAAASEVHGDGLKHNAHQIVAIVASNLPSSWVVTHRLRVAALSEGGGVNPARLVLPAIREYSGDRRRSPPPAQGCSRRRSQRQRLQSPLPLAPRPMGGCPLPAPPSLPSRGSGRGAGRGGGKRMRLPIDIDAVKDAGVRARVLRNRESARVSNARRKARSAAARAALQDGGGERGGGGTMPAVVGRARPLGETPFGLLAAAPPALLLGGSDA
ncbi:hypothetical protein MMPV_004517 [Pyropia vietnamensis]